MTLYEETIELYRDEDVDSPLAAIARIAIVDGRVTATIGHIDLDSGTIVEPVVILNADHVSAITAIMLKVLVKGGM